MPPSQVSALLKRELHVADLGAVFDWIDLEKPLGAASIAQVHKARLRQYARRPPLLQRIVTWPGRALLRAVGARSARAHRRPGALSGNALGGGAVTPRVCVPLRIARGPKVRCGRGFALLVKKLLCVRA